jgi:oxygen-independent coproporphyrinogen-3 oxidase
MCNVRLSKEKFDQKYEISFDAYFEEALENLKSLQEDHLVVLEKEQIKVTDIGRLLIRNIVMYFDYYLMQKQGDKPQFSRTV